MNIEARPESSRRSTVELEAAIRAWLASRAGVDDLELLRVDVPESNGMSSETVMVDAAWSGVGSTAQSGSSRLTHRLVFRLAPDMSSMPVFESYDMAGQFHVMADVARLSSVPVPRVIWLEHDPAALGSEFFVMERIDGEIPSDLPPYNFGDDFLYDARPDQRDRLERSSVGLLGQVHAIEDPFVNFDHLARTLGLAPDSDGSTCLRAQIERMHRHYRWVTADGVRSPLLESAFEWIDAHWPAEVGDPVMCWGDSRIGNVIYRDFEPVGVLDWEMATIGPRELDISWMIFMHQFFEDVAQMLELAGMPEFMRRENVVARYRQLTGYEPRDMDFYAVVSALAHGVIMFRIGRRSVVLGTSQMPDDPDDLVMHRRLLSAYMS